MPLPPGGYSRLLSLQNQRPPRQQPGAGSPPPLPQPMPGRPQMGVGGPPPPMPPPVQHTLPKRKVKVSRKKLPPAM